MSLLNVQGVPFLAKEIKDRLANIDPRLGLAIDKNAGKDAKWAVTYKWSEHDPRRAEVQSGKRDPKLAFDILGYLPEDCPVDTAFDYIQRRFRMLDSRADVRAMLDDIHKFNEKRRADIMKPHVELVNELVETNARHMFKDIGKSVGSTMDIGPRSKRDERDWRDYLHDISK